MNVIQIFGKTVVRHHCQDLNEYLTPELIASASQMLHHPLSRSEEEEYRVGPSRTTCDVHELSVLKTAGHEKLTGWIANKCLESATAFGVNNAKSLMLGRNWMNIMYKGSEGVCHNHSHSGKDPEIVAIFYPYVPVDGAELVFINNGLDKTMLDNYDEIDRNYQKVISGDLIIHDSTLFHTITKHTSESPRVCFIFEIDYQI